MAPKEEKEMGQKKGYLGAKIFHSTQRVLFKFFGQINLFLDQLLT